MKFQKTKETLNQLVADLSQASAIIHQVHWYMRGRGFLTKHPLMDVYRDKVEEQLDEVAERLIILDGAPYSTLEEFAANTKLESQTGDFTVSMDDNLARVVEVFRYLVSSYEEGIEIAGEEGDNVTEDMFIEFKGELEKDIWMIQAELGKNPGLDA